MSRARPIPFDLAALLLGFAGLVLLWCERAGEGVNVCVASASPVTVEFSLDLLTWQSVGDFFFFYPPNCWQTNSALISGDKTRFFRVSLPSAEIKTP